MRLSALILTSALYLLLVTPLASAQAIDNVTVDVSYQMDGQTTYLDGNTVSTTDTTESSSYPYIISEASSPDHVFGIVNFGDFRKSGVTVSGDTVSANMTQSLSDVSRSVFFLPFTEGSTTVVEERSDEIGQGLLDGSRFLSQPQISFAYPIQTSNTVKAALHYGSDISLIGDRLTMYSGMQRLIITNNETTIDNKVGIWIREQ